MDLGLSRITRLVRGTHKLLPWKAVHIAGTNGKGTTSRYLEALLERSNITVGIFNSPHLVDRHDCVRVHGRTVFEDIFLHCEEVVKQRNADAEIGATSFELLTATAFEVFNHAKVNVGIVECGLGGRLDATNVLLPDEKLCSIITRIGLDHQDVLGDTIEQIATEKAGIIKPGVPVVVDCANLLSVKQVIRDYAEDSGSTYVTSHSEDFDDYLASNALVAETAYDTVIDRLEQTLGIKRARLAPRDVHLTTKAAGKSFLGRFQRKSVKILTGTNRHIVLDGAHNEQAAKALRWKIDQQIATQHDVIRARSSVSEGDQPDQGQVSWVIAMTSTKNSESFLKALIRPQDRVVVCEFGPVDGMPWVKPQLKEVLHSLASDLTAGVEIATDPVAALRQAVACTPPGHNTVVTGSLYLVGDILRAIRDILRGADVYEHPAEGLELVEEPATASEDESKHAPLRKIATRICAYCQRAGHEMKDCHRAQAGLLRKLVNNATTQQACQENLDGSGLQVGEESRELEAEEPQEKTIIRKVEGITDLERAAAYEAAKKEGKTVCAYCKGVGHDIHDCPTADFAKLRRSKRARSSRPTSRTEGRDGIARHASEVHDTITTATSAAEADLTTAANVLLPENEADILVRKIARSDLRREQEYAKAREQGRPICDYCSAIGHSIQDCNKKKSAAVESEEFSS